MKLSIAAEYAVRGILVLTEEHGRKPVTLDAVCKRRKLPKQYLTKLFSNLAKAGLIHPVRGKGGGYTLTRSPDQISLLQVIEAVEGPIILNLCQHAPPQCGRELCKIRPMWADLQKTVREKLSALTLAQCLGN
jgi:Rrf2 family protein